MTKMLEPKTPFANLSIIIPQMPTEAELQQSSARWLDKIGPTLIDRWPAALMELSYSTTFIDRPDDFIDIFDGGFDRIAPEIADKIDAEIGFSRVFFRLNSRSPKDACWPLVAPVTCSGKEILSILACSERVLDDLARFSHSTAKAKICLRQFEPGMSAPNEYRCFIKDGKILAVAEYFNRLNPNNETFSFHSDIDERQRAAIDSYLIEKVIPVLPIDTVVVDVFAPTVDPANFKVIEINPYGLSDPVGAVSYSNIETGIQSIARLR